ncbi:MAG: phosphoribosylformylglycinamidine cyclo-ligase [Pseudomonadota bacterium]
MKGSPAYRDAGVDTDAGAALVDKIKTDVASTTRTGAAPDLGGFGGLFDLAACGYRDPMLVAATDGVGTKLKIAIESGLHDSVGIDLVAMCANDLVVQGAEPLFFLDYFATSALNVDHASTVVAGIAEGCRQAACALIGGETAEMPSMYAAKDYDLAGFCVGAVERDEVLPRPDLAAGDKVLGLASSGFHSNGFSLVRKVVAEKGLSYQDPAPFDREVTLGEALLEPTRIYVKSILAARRSTGAIKAMAHITGGGLIENVPRCLPQGLGAALHLESVPLPSAMAWLMQAARLSNEDMLATFNCGIGMVLVVAANDVENVTKDLQASGEQVYELGALQPSTAEQITISGFPLLP